MEPHLSAPAGSHRCFDSSVWYLPHQRQEKELDHNKTQEPQDTPFQNQNFGYQKDMDFFRESPVLEEHDSTIHTEKAVGEEEHE